VQVERAGSVRVEDAVESAQPLSGDILRDAFLRDIQRLTLGLVRPRTGSLWLGPWEMIRFGPPSVSDDAVCWRIEGGLLALAPGGTLTFRSHGSALTSVVEGYRPTLPLPIYTVTQVPFHHLITRLFLLRVRGRRHPPAMPSDPLRRMTAGAIDFTICAAAAAIAPRRARLPLFIGLSAGYHIAAWAGGGRTVGAIVMRQRVVALDGSRVTIGQALVRFALLPFALLRMRAVHDEVAGTEVLRTDSLDSRI
jgi:hypothetical protein